MTPISDRAAIFIAEEEGFRAEAYPDPIHGWEVPTVGYGSTTYPDGRKVKKGDRIGKMEARIMLSHFLNTQVFPVINATPCSQYLNENQMVALASFGYNLGPGYFTSRHTLMGTMLSDPSLWTAKEYVTEMFMVYCNPGTSAETGLKNRRKREAELFLKPVV